MKILTLIPARGGSKGIPGKNLYPLNGKPLLGYVCEAARKATLTQRVMVSTDDHKIAAYAGSCGVEVPFIRPEALAADESLSIDVALHALETMEHQHAYKADYLVYLQATSPLTTSEHIDQAISTLLAHDQADSLVSVVEIMHSTHPHKLMDMSGDRLVAWAEGSIIGSANRHVVKKLYARNGPAIIVAKTDHLKQTRNFYGKYILPFIMNRMESADIDDYDDLVWAEFLLQRRARSV